MQGQLCGCVVGVQARHRAGRAGEACSGGATSSCRAAGTHARGAAVAAAACSRAPAWRLGGGCCLLAHPCLTSAWALQDIEKRLSRPIAALGPDLSLPADIAARVAGGGGGGGSGGGQGATQYGQQRGGGVSKEVMERVQVRQDAAAATLAVPGVAACGRALQGSGGQGQGSGWWVPTAASLSTTAAMRLQAVRPAVQELARLEFQAQASFFQLKRKWAAAA